MEATVKNERTLKIELVCFNRAKVEKEEEEEGLEAIPIILWKAVYIEEEDWDCLCFDSSVDYTKDDGELADVNIDVLQLYWEEFYSVSSQKMMIPEQNLPSFAPNWPRICVL